MNHVFMGQDCSKADIVPLKFADLGIYRRPDDKDEVPEKR